MPKKRKFEKNINMVDKYISRMTYKDLKRNAVMRGKSFDEVLNGTIPGTHNWLVKNWDEPVNLELLDKYDDYVEEKLKERGYTKDDMPASLRLGFIAEKDEETGEVTKIKRVKGITRKKYQKRERNTKFNIFTGTKKALAFECADKGVPVDETVERVLEEFPDAKEKSVKIWYKRALKKLGK